MTPPRQLAMRAVSRRVYAALQQPGGATLADLRKAAWPDGRPRTDGAIFIMLKRIDRRLAHHGFAVARVGIGFIEHTYRVVVA
jgi:hypothetical protein